MEILSLDMSSKATGWCVGNEKELIAYGCITATNSNPITRIIKMRDEILKIVKQYNITTVVIEEVHLDVAVSHVYKILLWLQGVVVTTLYEYNKKIDISYILPNSWRAKIGIHTGKGIKRDSLKKKDIEYVNNKYNLSITSDDIADAICIKDSYFAANEEDFEWGEE